MSNTATNTISSVKKAADDVADRAASGLREGAEMGENLLRSAEDMASNVNQKLKSVGVDTDVMVDAAKGQATELQRLIADELKVHPLRTLGVAALVGLVAGLMVTR